MKNLESFGVQEMTSLEIKETNGGDQGYTGGKVFGAIAGTLVAVVVATVRLIPEFI